MTWIDGWYQFVLKQSLLVATRDAFFNHQVNFASNDAFLQVDFPRLTFACMISKAQDQFLDRLKRRYLIKSEVREVLSQARAFCLGAVHTHSAH